MPVDSREVPDPVAVVGGARALHGLLPERRRDPDRGEAERLDPRQPAARVGAVAGQALQSRRRGTSRGRSGRSRCAARPPRPAAAVVPRVAVRVAVGEEEVDPVGGDRRPHRRLARARRARRRRRRRSRRRGVAPLAPRPPARPRRPPRRRYVSGAPDSASKRCTRRCRRRSGRPCRASGRAPRGRERGDEVRPGRGDTLGLGLAASGRPRRSGRRCGSPLRRSGSTPIDSEPSDSTSSSVRVHGRQVGPARRGMEVAGTDADDDAPPAVPTPRAPGKRCGAARRAGAAVRRSGARACRPPRSGSPRAGSSAACR